MEYWIATGIWSLKGGPADVEITWFTAKSGAGAESKVRAMERRLPSGRKLWGHGDKASAATSACFQNWIVKNERGYYCGHKAGGQPTWNPKFKLCYTDDIKKATPLSHQGACNLQSNLFLMHQGFSDVIQLSD